MLGARIDVIQPQIRNLIAYTCCHCQTKNRRQLCLNEIKLDRNDCQKCLCLQHTLLISKDSIKYCLLLLWARQYGTFNFFLNIFCVRGCWHLLLFSEVSAVFVHVIEVNGVQNKFVPIDVYCTDCIDKKHSRHFLNVIYCVKMCWLLPLFSEVLTFFVHIKVNRAQNNISSTLTFIVPKKKGPSCVKVRPYLPIFSKFLQAKSSHFNRNPWDHIKGIIFPHTRFQLQIVHMDFHIDQQKAVWFESDFVWTMIHTLLHYCQNTFFATKFYKEESKA